MLGRGTTARWPAAEWAYTLDIYRNGLRTFFSCDQKWLLAEQRSAPLYCRLKGYIQSNSIMKLVLALKANAMPRRSLTKPTRVLYSSTQKAGAKRVYYNKTLPEVWCVSSMECVFVTLASCSLNVFVLNIWATASNAAVRGNMNCSN